MTYLTTRKPMRNLFSFHNEMGRIFGDLFASGSHEGGTDAEETSWMPTVDISEIGKRVRNSCRTSWCLGRRCQCFRNR